MEKLIRKAMVIIIEIMVDYLNRLPETTCEDFEKQRHQINKLEKIKKELENGV